MDKKNYGYENNGCYVENPDSIKKPIHKSVIILLTHFMEIRNVSEWADKVGYSRSYFSREVKLIFRDSPKNLFYRFKFFIVFLKNPDAKAYTIARDTGFDNEISLRQFLSRNFYTSIKRIRSICKRYPASILEPDIRALHPANSRVYNGTD